jgi:hypothetical protein
LATKKKPKMKSKAGKAREDKREQEQLRREQDDIPRVRFDEEA